MFVFNVIVSRIVYGCAIIKCYGSKVMVLVEPFVRVPIGEAIRQCPVLGPGGAAGLEAVAIARTDRTVFKDTVFKRPAIIKRLAHVLGVLQIAVPSVIGILPSPATDEFVPRTNTEFRCKAVGIALTGVFVVLGIAIGNRIIAAFYLEP